MSDVKHFTLVFEGDLRTLPNNPHKTDTSFGKPVAAGIGDAFAKLDALENSHAQLIEALEAVANDVHRKRGTISLGTLNLVAETLTQVREGGE